MGNENLNNQESAQLGIGAVSSRLNVYEYIWSKVFPN